MPNLQLFFVRVPKTKVMEGWIGTHFFSDNDSELMGRLEAQRVLAAVGGELHRVDFGNFTVRDIELMRKYESRFQTLLGELRTQEKEARERDLKLQREFQEHMALRKAQEEEARKRVEEEETDDSIPDIIEEPDLPAHENPISLEGITMPDVPEFNVIDVLRTSGISDDDVRTLATENYIVFPHYNTMRSQIAKADREDPNFDSREMMGANNDADAVRRVWLYLQLKALQNQPITNEVNG